MRSKLCKWYNVYPDSLSASALKMLIRLILLAAFVLPLAHATGDDLTENVAPFITKYCVECHNSQTHKAGLDLTRYKNDADVASNFRRWNNVVEFIRNGEMPPEEYQQPSIDERNAVIAQVEKILMTEALKHAGDPGIILRVVCPTPSTMLRSVI